ncbi:S8 family serine peptidase [Isoptericola dokdonensis]|uniref:Minor extracellular protease vpr n=1 Tax=Isoptericola dokdonensis DS-3 TaxID=1300344 RepID=A0A161I8T2_9MICO|nr:S8 family serine peptidase [Isoptericola dokdonensis]ANC32188.1 Minor extracellular protease vpr precursor [Isoptericola dokdonensis DS-3]
MRLRRHPSLIRLAATTSGAALVITSLAATSASATVDPDDLELAAEQPVVTSHETNGPKAPSSSLVETDPALLKLTSSKKVPVMVKYDLDAVASYDGSLPQYDATSPAVTGKSLAGSSAAERKYRGYVADQTAEISAEVTDAVPGTEIVQEFDTVYGGVAAMVPGDEIPALLEVPGVVAVQENTLEQPLTDSSTEFINAGAAYDLLGTTAEAGDGLVLGNIDTGLWPEHESFEDLGNLSPYDGPALRCDYGDNPLTEAVDPFECNDKLVGGYSFTEFYDANNPAYLHQGTARDAEGHGSHTSGTTAGNIVEEPQIDADIARIQGVAPGVKIVEYKALGPGGGYTSDLVAAVQQSILDDVDALNYSISGGSNVTDPIELAFLNAVDAGVFVAASAGNDGPGAGTSNHVSPWVTTVAASTQDRAFTSTLTLNADDGSSFVVEGASLTAGITEPLPVVHAAEAPYSDPLCLEPAPDGLFDGQIVVCERGENARVAKGYNVLAGDAAGMVLYNPALADVATDNHYLPAVHVADGTELKAYLDSHTGITGSFPAGSKGEGQGDVMAAFSSRGPAGPFIKPDVTAPGVSILAAMTPTPESTDAGPAGKYYQAISGTSMSAPHIAGVGLLLKASYPDWTPGQIKSAIMTQSLTEVLKEDLTTPADPFDMGAGRVDVGEALEAPFTISETTANYNALTTDPVHAIDLNIPSINAPTMPGRLSTTRTLENTSGKTLVVRPKVDAPEGSTIKVTPQQATIRPGGTASFDVTITDTSASGAQKFGAITFRTNHGDGHIPVAFVPTQGNVVASQSCDATSITTDESVTCTVTATNESFNEQTVNATTQGTGALKGLTAETATLTGAEPGVPSVDDVPQGSPAGYLDLAGFGITPVTVGDEDFITYTVPAYTYNGRTYTSLSISTNGYVVAGGGTSEDSKCCELPDGPSSARPNSVLAPFWTDLNGEGAEGIRIGSLNDGVNQWLVVQWDVNVWGTTDARTFQAWIGLGSQQDVSFTYAEPMDALPADLTFLVGAENHIGQGDMVAELPDGTDKVVTSTDPTPGGSLTYEVTLDAKKKAGDGVVRTEIVADEVPGTTILETPVTVTKSERDDVKPTVTVKDGAEFTVGSDGTYSKVSYKLYDAGKVDMVVLNGVEKDLTDNVWSDLNYVRPGVFGAKAGNNTLKVHDVAGNVTTVRFTLTS